MAKFKLTKTMLAGLIIVAVLAVQFTGAYDFTKLIPAPATTPTPTTTPTPSVVTGSHTANAKWNIRDYLTKTATAAGDTGYVCINRADSNGYFDMLQSVEETEFDAAPDTSAGIYTTGDELLIQVTSDNDPTNGDETYSRWFVIQRVDNGAQIKAFPNDNPITALTEYTVSGKIMYKINYAVCVNTGMTVSWLEGATPYWVFGDYFEVYGRADNAAIVQSISSNGVTLTSVSDGSTWDDTSTEVNANATLAGDSQDFYFEITGEQADVAWGLPQLAISADGSVKQYNAVLVICFSGTTMATDTLVDDGWIPFSVVGLTSNVTLYYPITNPTTLGLIPTTGNVINTKIQFTISDTGLSASTEYNYGGWMHDWQNFDDVERGSFRTATPSVYGMITEYGCDSVIQATALTVASGRAATPQLYGYFTTNA